MVKTTVEVSDMSCGMCEAHINDVIRKNFKIKKVSSSFKKGIAEIISDEILDTPAIKYEIEKTGYHVGKITSEPYEKKGLFRK